MQCQALSRAGRWALALLFFITSTAAAQVRISGGISGTVTDQSGGVVPGATVQLKDEGTGNPRETITNESGLLCISRSELRRLSGHCHASGLPDRGLQQGRRRSVADDRPARRVSSQAACREVVTVEGATPVLETSSNVISGTLNRKDITELPLRGPQRVQLRAPGARRRAAPTEHGQHALQRHARRHHQHHRRRHQQLLERFRSGGTSFFATVPPRLGAIEEVTVASGGLGADAGVEGRRST